MLHHHTLSSDILHHHLRIFGLDTGRIPRPLQIIVRPTEQGLRQALDAPGQGLLVLLQPEPDACALLGVVWEVIAPAMAGAVCVSLPGDRPRKFRSLHELHRYVAADVRAYADLAEPQKRRPGGVWVHLRYRGRDVLILGTAAAEDLLRFRQGDPNRVAEGQRGGVAGFDHERANYLFEGQLDEAAPFDRPADTIAHGIAGVVADIVGVSRKPMLPNNAPGAVVITGDDDQAYLERYREQLQLLDGLPVTYFLHPLTRFDRPALMRMFRRRRVELGLHPDSLEVPRDYPAALPVQADWFQELTGFQAVSVRNHGFLSEGYWAYVPHWSACGLRVSSNLTATDGTALNGSYLPARVALDGTLSEHWSVLTAIGDGLLYAYQWTADAAAARIIELGERIVAEGIPGVLVVNLHPQNVDRSAPMHHALRELVGRGFHPWTLSECIGWFQSRDGSSPLAPASFSDRGGWSRVARLLTHLHGGAG